MSKLKNPGRRHEIKSRITGWIREQRLHPGDRILPQTELARLMSTTEVTIHRALTELCDEGVIHRRKGVGTFVGPDPTFQRVRNCCLVLPAAGLDSADNNPTFWPQVQTVLRAFIEEASDGWSFGTRAVAPDTDPLRIASSFTDYDAVFFHFSHPNVPLIQHLVEHRIAPVIRLGLPDRDTPCVTIDHDRAAGVELGVSELIDRGLKRVGFIGSQAAWGRFGAMGYEAAHAAHHQPVDLARMVRIADGDPDAISEAVDALIGKGQQCDAIYCDGDHLALTVIEELIQRGLTVPDDVSVMGYDGVDQYAEPPLRLASVKIPYRQMIHDALALAQDAADDRYLEPRHLAYMPTLQDGATIISANQA